MATNQLFKPPPATPREPGQPWRLKEAAKFLRVSVRTLTRMEKSGKIRLIRELGGRVLVPDSEVARLAL